MVAAEQSSMAVPFLELIQQSGDVDRVALMEQCYTKLVKGFVEEGNPQAALGAIQVRLDSISLDELFLGIVVVIIDFHFFADHTNMKLRRF